MDRWQAGCTRAGAGGKARRRGLLPQAERVLTLATDADADG